MSFCRVIDFSFRANMTVSSAKKHNSGLDLAIRSLIYARESMGPITEPCRTSEKIVILFDLTVFQGDSSFVDPFSCSLVVTCWERAYL